MKRFHVHVAVPDLGSAIQFHSTLFGAEPSVSKPDYAKWMLEDPRVNFAISQRGAEIGVNHLGFQVDSGEELEALHSQLETADRGVVAETGASCYAKSDKYWVKDPAGIAWESFHTLGSILLFGGTDAEQHAASGCCAPETRVETFAQDAANECRAPVPVAGKVEQLAASTGCCRPVPTTVKAALPKSKSAACCS